MSAHQPDMDRLENLLAHARGIVDVMRAAGDLSGRTRPDSVENSLWAVNEMLDAIKDELFGSEEEQT